MAQQVQAQDIWDSNAWKDLEAHAKEIKEVHLRDVLSSSNEKLSERNESLTVHFENIMLDCTRQQANETTLSKLIELAKVGNISSKIEAMFKGEAINKSENRSVLHIALRAPSNVKIVTPSDNQDQVPKVHKVLNQIKDFSNSVRNGDFLGYSGERLLNVISIGIGGSYLGAEFVFEALRTNTEAKRAANGRNLKFYANIDPIGFARATSDLDASKTIVIIVSKTFTTRETMMNANLIRQWFIDYYKRKDGNLKETEYDTILSKHFVAVSANPTAPTKTFNIAPSNIFEFWDWVGGRYSVTSAVGILPLSLHYSYDIMCDFLKGCRNMDEHFYLNRNNLGSNISAMLGLFGVWNSTFLKYSTRGLIPYCEALLRLPAHIQQLDMESNGKRVGINDSKLLPFETGEINFGEPGTNAQHSFFQLIHQGRVIPCDFIAFSKSQLSNDRNTFSNDMIKLINNNHDELMSNFFAQADALAIGKTTNEVKKELEEDKEKKMDENEIEYLLNQKEFPGNRPSSLLLFKGELDAFATGQLLALFEHRTVVQGFIWSISSFDQWGVELGKVLGKKVRNTMDQYRNDGTKPSDNYNENTQNVLLNYLKNSSESK